MVDSSDKPVGVIRNAWDMTFGHNAAECKFCKTKDDPRFAVSLGWHRYAREMAWIGVATFGLIALPVIGLAVSGLVAAVIGLLTF